MRWTSMVCWGASLLLGAPAVAQVRYPPSPRSRVTVAEGVLEGAEPIRGVRAFLGIPYAMPPVGPLRWRPPEPHTPWNGTRLAVEHGSPCAQQRFGWNNALADHGSEDCLFLNVWAPVGGERHPVMVYLHGGSNTAGSAAEELSNGLTLVPRGVVLVTLDYRLGIFGFLRSARLDRESAHHASGDYGLMDQIAALDWMRRNIARFGGDPGKVTLFGQSAGAVDTGLLMTSPLARGLFAQALEESGQVLGLMPTATRAESEAAWAPVAAELGGDPTSMRRASMAAVLAAEARAPKPPPEHSWGFRGASVDGWVLPEDPAAAFARGAEAPVSLVIGSNAQELGPRADSVEAVHQRIEAVLDPQHAHALEAAYARPGADPLLGDPGTRWATDRDFRCAVRQVALWHSGHGWPTYVYQFDRPAPGAATVTHSSELFFVFHFFAPHGETLDDEVVSRTLQAYWTTFSRTGEPGTAWGTAWPRFTEAAGEYVEQPERRVRTEVKRDLGGEPCRVIDDALRARTAQQPKARGRGTAWP